jgi:hypothetical protein
VIALITLAAGCSSSQDKGSQQGSLAVKLGASRAAAGVQAATAGSEDPMANIKAANVTISAIEARNSGGTWVAIDSGLPVVVDLLALVNGGNTFTLPADLLPEGQYSALQIRITQVELTLLDDTKITIVPPGTGWLVQIPVDFGVVAGQATVVTLNVRVDLSFKLMNGEFEFEPEVEVESVEQENAMHH